MSPSCRVSTRARWVDTRDTMWFAICSGCVAGLGAHGRDEQLIELVPRCVVRLPIRVAVDVELRFLVQAFEDELVPDAGERRGDLVPIRGKLRLGALREPVGVGGALAEAPTAVPMDIHDREHPFCLDPADHL